ncbi:MAG: HU family DNA-binding protein [Alloprevotella sp.]|nr:HU family DNA-binding protein [Alloprevotella sp.]MBR1652116.1 HU family DNA-binding protein [Alloprevotella sp.]
MITLIKKKGTNPQDKSAIYFPQWTRISTVNETQLAKRVARGSTFSVGEINGVFNDFPQSIIDELLDGNAVKIAGLGTFKLRVQGKSQTEKKLVTSAGAKISVVFEPAAELTSRLDDEKEFRFVEVPTTEGQQDADEGGDTPDGGGSAPAAPGGGDNGGGNSGGSGSGDGGFDE